MELLPRELKSTIVLMSPDGVTWKSVRLVSRGLREVCAQHDVRMIRRFSDHTTTLVAKLPDKPWNWGNLTRHLSLEYITANSRVPWDKIESDCDRIFHGAVETFGRSSILADDVPSGSSDVTPDMVSSCPNMPWNYDVLSLREEMIDAALRVPSEEWDWNSLARVAPLATVAAHPDAPWGHWGLSWNANLTLEFVLSRPDVKWDTMGLSNVLPVRDVMTCLDDETLNSGNVGRYGRWDRHAVTCRATMEEIARYPDFPWHWPTKSMTATWEEISENPDHPWDWCGISANPNMSWDVVVNNQSLPWDYDVLSRNRFGSHRKNRTTRFIVEKVGS